MVRLAVVVELVVLAISRELTVPEIMLEALVVLLMPTLLSELFPKLKLLVKAALLLAEPEDVAEELEVKTGLDVVVIVVVTVEVDVIVTVEPAESISVE